MSNFSQDYGVEIVREKANPYFARFIAMKEIAAREFPKIFDENSAERRYYCGRKGHEPTMEDWGYYFDMDSLNRLIEKVKDFGGDGVIAFNGVRLNEDGNATETNGRPTLMLFPIKKGTNEKGEDGYLVGNKGEEHPGTGGGRINKDEKGEVLLPTFLSSMHKILNINK